ncbi:MAG TPA: AbrB/MazE/SpoVT family DNA-binding domain-containing protein [Allosphingosinicella sp.]|jgi:AbrB family looped-hinge helix DNA binding protein|nr:AbrB/MazE/SpoVT family DNA-binding domain-containing protein [Allosphingosinicella sp.]
MNKPVTRLSTKGQVILPKEIRARRKWTSGMRLIVEETPEGVLLKPERRFPPTTIDEVAGCLKYDGPSKTLEDMDRAITEEIEARRARGRY